MAMSIGNMYEVIYNYTSTDGHYTGQYTTQTTARRKAKSYVKYTGCTAAIQCPDGSGILITPISGEGFMVRGTAVMESI